jgi:hypothetical protein
MDPKLIVLYLDRKGWTAHEVHDNLVATFAEETIAYSTITWFLHEARINHSVATPFSDIISPHLTSPQLNESDEAVLKALEELPFYSL